MTPTYPEAEYLGQIGRFVYAANALEWLALGELPRLARCLPDGLTVERLAGLTMGTIADRLTQASYVTTEPTVQAFLREAGEHLQAVAPLRNNMLHARPATFEGDQRLYRWRVTPLGADVVAITPGWLDEQIAEVERRVRELDRVRSAACC